VNWPLALAGVIDELGHMTDGTVGVIVPTHRLDDLTWLTLPPSVSVVTALEAKGMEYDVVVVVAPDEIVARTPGGPRVLYVALTRPTQRLITLDFDQPGEWREFLE
ncbi:MAG: helicase, partial [Propionibacteriaceae bacterium]|nr:helicase [Propionibacteriaceae bacterium]